ncbi:argininosuccinate lyase [Streptomyces mashuensis]|uniref:argininosuccinate lyase n=1 Tax=Streptomyces mashuensis TaxID=33904 RepID=A0A919B826_9ACTN|nr:argininosuccinate lyase [Streptomyces mashuensis]GHF69379.1 argininosuccinate lyase [Streptomyces mashuensis]
MNAASTPTTDAHAASASEVDTGRLRTPLAETARQILFGESPYAYDAGAAAELHTISEVDRAHLLMLERRGIADPAKVRALLAEIEALRATGFAGVRDRPAPRGRYLSYESYLIERLGADTGGVLHTGRSRNDLNATTVRLRLRQPYAALLEETRQLLAVLRARAEEHRDVVMPAYTHRQPAVPITYGHYLLGLANAVLWGLDGLLHAGEEMDVNPLGAGAVGGTSVAVDPEHTTRLLGFRAPAPNSLHAVASRDFVLRLLSATGVLGVGVARAAQDFSVWTTEEAGLLHVPDDLVGSSSMMPQKRNPFPLEHIHGKAAAPLGGYVGAASAMLTAGYTNAIAVGTEAVAHLWPALRNITEAVVLMRLFADGTRPVPARMTERAEQGYTAATHLAERLVADGVPFRSAHHEVGRMVLDGLAAGTPLDQVAGGRLEPGTLAPAAVVAATDFGGGPGPASTRHALEALDAGLDRLGTAVDERRRRWATAADELQAQVEKALQA